MNDASVQKAIALDLEIIHSIDHKRYSFGRPWELGVSVACTYSPEEGYRDWFGDMVGGRIVMAEDSREMDDLVRYLNGFSRVITFNGVRFDLQVLDGYFPGHYPSQHTSSLLKGKHVDLLLDIYEITGKRCGLDALAEGTLSEKKVMEGALAPELWAKGQRLEVIEYCRDDTRKTYDIWAKGCADKQVVYIYNGRRTSVQIPNGWKAR